MGKIGLVILIGVVILALSAISLGTSIQGKGNDKIRVIAHTDKEVSDALANGCKIVRKVKTLKALVCSKDVASSLGLQEDIQVFSMDSRANTQIRADSVQVSGNNGDGRKVVVVDTGYNYNHQELSSSYLGGYDFVNDDNDPLDDNGHGSHVAGIITADGIDLKAKGVAPGTGIIAAKVLDASGGGYFSDVVTAIYWAVDGPDGIAGTADDFNADAISMSIGTVPPYTYSKSYCDGVLPDLTNAIKYAVGKGVVVVVAAGNSGDRGVSIPGCISYSTTVGAVDSQDKIASFSSKGPAVDITAPGVNIYSVWLGASYKTASGTSMATPMVSGTVALIKFAHPGYTPAQIETALFKTAKDLGNIGKDTSYGWGRVDAYGAVNYVACVPTTEVCDGIDNDCDGLTDEDLGQTTCGIGACQVTVNNCVGGVPQTCTPGTPTAELCDGIDNNCDGATDEGGVCEAVKCWSKDYQYLYKATGQAKKFCKCVQGTYGYKSYSSEWLKSTVYKYVDTGDNEKWTVTSQTSYSPVYQVTCSDNAVYRTGQDYFYPKPK